MSQCKNIYGSKFLFLMYCRTINRPGQKKKKNHKLIDVNIILTQIY